MAWILSRKSLLIFLIIFLAYVVGLWGASIPLTGDQKVYLSIALEMFEKKDWIIPSLFNEPNFLKPPFQYWATIIGWKVFGVSVFGAMIPSVLALISSAFLSFQISKKLNLKSPALAALLFASTIGTMTYGTTAQMEIWIVFFVLAAWLSVLHSRLFLAFILVGVMAWVKGPLYPVLWTISFFLYDPSVIKTKKVWFSAILGVVIGLSWYFLAAITHRQEILNQFLYTENLGKMNTHQGSVLGLWGEFFFSLFPWGIILLLAGFHKGVRTEWKKNQRFYLSYSLFSAVFFTFFPYRVNTYLYFLTPMMAMMASEIDLNFTGVAQKIGAALYVLIFIPSVYLFYQLNRGGWIDSEILWGAILAQSVFMLGFIKSQWLYVGLASLILVNLIRISAVQIGEKDFDGLKNGLNRNSADVAYYIDSKDIWHEYGLVSAVIGKSVHRIYSKNELDIFLAQGGSVILSDDQNIDLNKNIQCSNWQRLKRRMKFPLKKMLLEGVNWGNAELVRNYKVCSLGQ